MLGRVPAAIRGHPVRCVTGHATPSQDPQWGGGGGGEEGEGGMMVLGDSHQSSWLPLSLDSQEWASPGSCWPLVCVCVCVCAHVRVHLHAALLCVMGNAPSTHVGEDTDGPAHLHTDEPRAPCPTPTRVHTCTSCRVHGCTRALSHTRLAHRRASLHSLLPGRPALPAGGACWPPCPLIHLACQPVPGAPISFTPSHLAAQ